jgi:hypothetical protein
MKWFDKYKETNSNSVPDDLEDAIKQIENFRQIYSKAENVDRDIASYANGGRVYPFFKIDQIIRDCYFLIRDNARLRRDNKELKGVVDGNGEYYGIAWRASAERFRECQQLKEDATSRLAAEKQMYFNLYEKNRKIETEAHMLEREIEILKLEIERLKNG